MSPIVVDGCFGWFHPGAGSRGVVLCAPVGREADSTYRAWGTLAEHLASRGVSALRFDYPGLGNSRDLETGEDALRAWIASIKDAASWLRSRGGIDQVGLVGMRLGAALALSCAEELDFIAQLVLLAPVVSGAAHQKQRAMLDRLSRRGNLTPATDSVHGAGALFTAEVTIDLRPLDCVLQRAPAPKVLIAVESASRATTSLGDKLETLGAAVHKTAFSGYGALMVDPEVSVYPASAFGEVVDWLADPSAESVQRPRIPPTSPARLDLSVAKETGVLVEAETPIFGVLCEPNRSRADRPGVLFLNTAGAAHSGMNRMWVSMARRSAALGVASLRFDIAGIGDSSDRSSRGTGPVRVEDGFDDVVAAARWLKARGCRTVTLVGFCWGAQLAYNVAVETDEVDGLVMINSRRQFWDLDDSASTAKVFSTYFRLIQDPEKWRSLLKGEIAPGELWRFARETVKSAVRAGSERLRGADPSLDTARKLRSLQARGISALMIQGRDDPFLAEIEDYFGNPRGGLSKFLHLETRFVDGLDHFLRSEKNIADLVDLVGVHLRKIGSGDPETRFARAASA